MERIDTSAMVESPQPNDGQLIKAPPDRVFPRGNPVYGDCVPYELSPGQAVDFPVVRDNLIRWARLKVPFFMKWENVPEASTGGEPRHYAYFYSRKLVVESRMRGQKPCVPECRGGIDSVSDLRNCDIWGCFRAAFALDGQIGNGQFEIPGSDGGVGP
ncbi:MAG TPA: hypothetical protein PLK77_08975 [Pyrinomonadaceae bacterium]|nr:hypothetical protein [Pyrinomonadaceae bacterium]